MSKPLTPCLAHVIDRFQCVYFNVNYELDIRQSEVSDKRKIILDVIRIMECRHKGVSMVRICRVLRKVCGDSRKFKLLDYVNSKQTKIRSQNELLMDLSIEREQHEHLNKSIKYIEKK